MTKLEELGPHKGKVLWEHKEGTPRHAGHGEEGGTGWQPGEVAGAGGTVSGLRDQHVQEQERTTRWPAMEHDQPGMGRAGRTSCRTDKAELESGRTRRGERMPWPKVEQKSAQRQASRGEGDRQDPAAERTREEEDAQDLAAARWG